MRSQARSVECAVATKKTKSKKTKKKTTKKTTKTTSKKTKKTPKTAKTTLPEALRTFFDDAKRGAFENVRLPDDLTGEAVCAFVVLKQARPAGSARPAS